MPILNPTFAAISLILNLVLLGLFAWYVISRRGGLSHLLKRSPQDSPHDLGDIYFKARLDIALSMPESLGCTVFLGDSLTEQCPWNELLTYKNVINRGIGGDTISGVQNRVPEIVRHKPERVFLLAGTNNVIAEEEVEQILDSYKKLVDTIRSLLPESTLFIQSILPFSEDVIMRLYPHTKAGSIAERNRKIRELNTQIEKISDGNKIRFINIYNFFEHEGQLKEIYTYDGTHLSGQGYLQWKKSINDFIK